MRQHIVILSIVALLLVSTCFADKSSKGKKIKLKAGKSSDPVISSKQAKQQSKQQPQTDASYQDYNPGEVSGDPSKINDVKDKYESGTPPKFPDDPQTSDVTAHDSEVIGCRDHPNADRVCKKCDNACFPQEHETYTYSYCRRSCNLCDKKTTSFHTFWRLRAGSDFTPTWMLSEVEFYHLTTSNRSLIDDPSHAYAKNSYDGYKASYAFDGNNATFWYPDGWGLHNGTDDWIAFEFPVAVRIHGVRILNDIKNPTAAPTKIFIEASDKKYEGFETKWTINNPTNTVDRNDALNDCPVLWRKWSDSDDSTWCYRLMAQPKTWEQAHEGCEEEGGELASVLSKNEEDFIFKELKVCGFAWIGLSKQNNAYYWEDSFNSTFRDWRDDLSYSDLQKETLDCVSADASGKWYLSDCTSKFNFLCKKKIEIKDAPRTDLIPKPFPYPPEVPPVIFFYPNMTVPVINTNNLPAGTFPDANGNVVAEEEEESTSLSSIFYQQSVKHLLEKGLKPTDELKPDDNEDPNHYTKQLNKIALDVDYTSTGKNQSGVKPSVNLDTNKLPQPQSKEIPVHAETEPTKPDTAINPDNQQGIGAPTVDGKPASDNIQEDPVPAAQPISGPSANGGATDTSPSNVPSQPSGDTQGGHADANPPSPLQPPKTDNPTSQQPPASKPEKGNAQPAKPPKNQEGTETTPPASVGEAGDEDDDSSEDGTDNDDEEDSDDEDEDNNSSTTGKNLPETPNQIRNKQKDVDSNDKATEKDATVGGQSSQNLIKNKVKNTMAKVKNTKAKTPASKKKSAFHRSNVTSDGESENESGDNSESKELNDIINSMNDDII